jgi:hypothetical protein
MMLFLVGLEVTGGILAFSMQGKLAAKLSSAMESSMKLYISPGPEGEVAKEAWNSIQNYVIYFLSLGEKCIKQGNFFPWH